MDLTITLAVYAATVLVSGALGYAIGQAVGHKDGFDKGVKEAEVSFLVEPYAHVEAERAEVGYTLRILCKGEQVLEPIDVVTRTDTGKKLDKDKERVAQGRSDALGAATTFVNGARAAGVNAKLADKT